MCILRRLPYRRVPNALVDRPKMGATAPVHDLPRGGAEAC
jgi:hypothetical protein